MKFSLCHKRMRITTLSTAFLMIISCGVKAQTPAFPTAEGFGMWATGGRGGKVVEVTTLEDNGSANLQGSLRWALKQHSGKPITIVFRVSGIIDLKGKDLRSKRNNITIAGQTAPGDGICIKGESVNFGGSFNMIVRHLRFRTGAYTPDSTEVNAACVIHENGGNFIYDHCSMSWSAEELCDFADGYDITVQWSIFSEGLCNSINGKGARGYGPVLAGAGASYHHNLMAHNFSRSPRFGVSTKVDTNMVVDYVNNVNYNFGKATACYGGENEMGSKGSVKINMVNNYYKQGPAYPDTRKAYFVRASYEKGIQGTAYSKWHLGGNYISGTANQKLNTNNYSGVHFEEYSDQIPSCTINDLKSDHHQIPYPVHTESAESAFDNVILKSGAFPRDTVDRRVTYEALTGTASRHGIFNNHAVSGIIDSPSNAGGWPEYNTYNTIVDNDHDGMDDQWETDKGLNPEDPEDRNRITRSGYTCLEVYLNSLVGENIALDFSTNTKEASQNKSKVFIDRSGEVIYIKSSKPIVDAILFDINGNIIKRMTGAEITSMHVTELASGIYILQLRVKNGTLESIKLLK